MLLQALGGGAYGWAIAEGSGLGNKQEAVSGLGLANPA
jgi:hypothetical protein